MPLPLKLRYHNLIQNSLLEPIGRHRAVYTIRSPGKKSKHRKRKRTSETLQEQTPAIKSQPPKPEVLDFLTVGLNSTTRCLESNAALSRPRVVTGTESHKPGNQEEAKHLAVVVLPKPVDDLMYAHLPMLCFTASLSSKGKAATRLVLLDPFHERTIAAAMGLPRVGVLGVMDDTPGAASLLSYVRDNVEPVEVPWLADALSGNWMGVTLQTHVPEKA